MSDSSESPLRLREAVPADLPQLEAWCLAFRPDEAPPFVSVTLSEFLAAASRGFLLIVVDGAVERGLVVVSRLWSNRQRGEAAVIDDVLADPSIDSDLLIYEIRRYVASRGIEQLFSRGKDNALIPV